MVNPFRRLIPMTITFVVGLLLTANYFWKQTQLQVIYNTILSWTTLLYSFALIVAVVNLAKINIVNIAKRKEEWSYSSVPLVVLLVVASVSSLQTIPSVKAIFDFLIGSIFTYGGAAVTGFLAFYIVSAAFRAFRVKTIDATLMLSCAIIVMLTNAPIGATIWSGIPVIGNWIQLVPSVAGTAGLIIGIALATLSVSVRTILGYERGYLGEE